MQPDAHAQPLLDLQLPLMHVAPHRSLRAVYLRASALEPFDVIRRTLEPLGVTVSLSYTYRDPAQSAFIGILALDQTDASESEGVINAALSGVSGVTVLGSQSLTSGLAAFEMNQLNVAGTPVVVMARPFLGLTHKRLIESLGEQAANVLFRAGEDAGKLAASGVPALTTAIGAQLATPLIRQRFYDLQVFAWATVVGLNVDDQFVGEALLADDFEATAWHGKSPSAVCHWIRGFLTGALSSLIGHALRVSEPECQAKGDRYCRMVIRKP